jgi:hypothetical protein
MRRPPPRPQPAPPAKRPPDEDFDPEATATGIHIIVSAATLVPAAAAAAWTAPLAMRGPAPPGRTPGHREPAAGESAPAGPAPETPVEALEGETVLASMAAATPGSVEEIVLSTEPASATAGALSAPASAAPDAPRRPPRFDEVEDDAELPEEFLPAPRRLPKTWLRLALVAVAVLALLISTIHSRRGELMRDPGTASWLGKLYGAFGSPARPTWEPRLLIIEDSAAEADRAGRLSVTTIFRNGAEFPQPFPILRVTLTDRWDQTLSRQDFAPIEYLQPGTPGDMIGAGQQVEANVLMLSTQSEAVGFNLDLCLDPGDGELRCALDDG